MIESPTDFKSKRTKKHSPNPIGLNIEFLTLITINISKSINRAFSLRGLEVLERGAGVKRCDQSIFITGKRYDGNYPERRHDNSLFCSLSRYCLPIYTILSHPSSQSRSPTSQSVCGCHPLTTPTSAFPHTPLTMIILTSYLIRPQIATLFDGGPSGKSD